ncbi:MAG: VOC family protein [Chitinophagales bacterium]|nr:VOC family protein [Chitinophagales bacterium]
MHDFISGIQQVGIGVADAHASMLKYKDLFGIDVLVFDDVADAALMTQYTGGTVHNRRAILSMNLSGGGGFEIWQYKSRTPSEPAQKPQYGDLGINAPKIKCYNVEQSHQHCKKSGSWVSDIQTDPAGQQHFWVKDHYGNVFNVVKGWQWFQQTGKMTGGVSGAVIGVSDMERAIVLYRDVLGISDMVYDVTDTFSDNPESQPGKYRRVLLKKPQSGKGGFGKLLGSIEIELVQALDRTPVKIFADRYWGDCGFIHLCFDVINMDGLKKIAIEKGFNFSVDSENSFDMENAAGRFCYIESPEGTLIELVETHKVPVLKKLGLYINLKKRNLEKPLPDWMVKMLALSKVK